MVVVAVVVVVVVFVVVVVVVVVVVFFAPTGWLNLFESQPSCEARKNISLFDIMLELFIVVSDDVNCGFFVCIKLLQQDVGHIIK